MVPSAHKGSGLHLYVYRYAEYPSPALTDLVVGFLQSRFPQSNLEISTVAVSRKDDALCASTPFLLYKKYGDKIASRDPGGSAANSTVSSACSTCPTSEEQLLPLHGGQPLSDWASARLVVYEAVAAGTSVDFLLGMHVQPRLLKDKTTSQKEEDSSVSLRYTVALALDICESWWTIAEAQAVTGSHASDADASAEGFAKYFAELLGTSGAEGVSLPFLFDTQFPTLADMGLLALVRRFAAGRMLLQKVLQPYFTPPLTAEGSTSSAAASAAKCLSGWMDRVTAATQASGDGVLYGQAAGTERVGGVEAKTVAALCSSGKNKKPEGDAGVVSCETVTRTKGVNGLAASGGAGTPVDGPDATGAVNFLKQIVENDLRMGKHKTVITRFPPEPNGFLHLGHAKSICVNFGLATAFNGRCHLRFDDTNPMKEEMRYIQSIQRDVRWLGGDWGGHLYYASDYFQQLYDWAEFLIKKGLAFVDDDDQETIRRKRGSITQPGENSGYRDRSIEENLDLFRRMKAGEFEEGDRVLRAKIDMKHNNMNMRDPIMYRILKKSHPRTGDEWVIYPTYDYAHGQSDSIEGITHSICTLEFELHRPLYDWFQEKLEIPLTRQIEFARLNVTNTVMSKRKLLALVLENWVSGWDDPRLPTLSGLRRRGVPAAALRTFCDRVGVARRESVIQLELLERCIREALHPIAPRRFAIQQPLLVSIVNYEGKEECITAPNHPENPAFGTRELHFTSSLFIDREDFMETPVPGYHRLVPGGEVRLKHAYWIKCEQVVKDASGQVVELRCTYDPQSKTSSVGSDGRKVKGTIQWLSAKDAAPAELRIYGRLFNKTNPEEVEEGNPDSSWRDYINPDSLKVYKGLVERCVTNRKLFPPQSPLQFERLGFFTPDASTLPKEEVPEEEAGGTGQTAAEAGTSAAETEELPVFNLTVSLQEGFTSSEDAEKEKAKAQDKLAREKAAMERQKKKEEREMKKLLKEKQLSPQQVPAADFCKRESAARS